MKDIACDWDNTLVDSDGEWLDGAVLFLRRLRRRGYSPFIHSCRANWPGGRDQIAAKLATSGFKDMRIEPKPAALRYVDDLNVLFDGDYQAVFDAVTH